MLEDHLPPVEMARLTSAAVRPDIPPIANGKAISLSLKARGGRLRLAAILGMPTIYPQIKDRT